MMHPLEDRILSKDFVQSSQSSVHCHILVFKVLLLEYPGLFWNKTMLLVMLFYYNISLNTSSPTMSEKKEQHNTISFSYNVIHIVWIDIFIEK